MVYICGKITANGLNGKITLLAFRLLERRDFDRYIWGNADICVSRFVRSGILAFPMLDKIDADVRTNEKSENKRR